MTSRRSKRIALLSAALLCFVLSPAAQKETLTPLSEIPVAVKGDEIGDMLRKWYADGTAAGNLGDYYDNRDRRHSLLNMAPYPQLQKIEYTEEERKSRQDWGMQQKILPGVVFGNSSTSASRQQSGSNVRSYYTNPRGLAFLFTQYTRNNLYIYPEHQDHDPGRNGVSGYGDLFPTNTPYLITSQGSSGSDRPFMRAMPYVLAAFRPDVKKKLVQSGLLMPCIQMILRMTSRHLTGSKDYLTGRAHPTVFEGSHVDVRAMVEMAHGITVSDIPPISLIRLISEDTPARGVDYFEPEQTEKLADTPAVIARIFRGSNYLRKLVVSAEESRDLNNRPLKFHWIILRGDPGRIRIKPRNPSGSVAEITVSYQERAPIFPGSSLESNRVDIGVFAHNGAYYSPPAFITFYTLDNEARTYGADGRIVEIGYGMGTSRIWIADWKAFFEAMASQASSWPAGFLQRQFQAEEIAALAKVSEEFQKARAMLLARRDELNAAQKKDDKNTARINAARKAVAVAQQLEKDVLQGKRGPLNLGAAGTVLRALNLLLQDPDLWSQNAGSISRSAPESSRDALNQIEKILIDAGMAEKPDAASFRLRIPVGGRLTRFEKGMIERFNGVVLSRIMLPGIISAEWLENYVDHRIASAKQWRDVYRYAPDGTPAGWMRYQAGGAAEFNAEGLLVIEKDTRGRCTRARVVRYELEPRQRDPNIRPKMKLVPTETIREYGYSGPDDWKGHGKSQ